MTSAYVTHISVLVDCTIRLTYENPAVRTSLLMTGHSKIFCVPRVSQIWTATTGACCLTHARTSGLVCRGEREIISQPIDTNSYMQRAPHCPAKLSPAPTTRDRT